MEALVYLRDLVVILGFGVLIVAVFHRFKLPSTAGFIFAGVIVGPQALGFIDDIHQVEVLAEVGVALLLFGIGLELSLEKLRRLWKPIVTGGILQVGITIIVAFFISRFYGLPVNSALFVGFMVMSISLRGSETVGALAVGVWGLMLALSIGLAVTLLQLGLALGWESWKVALAFVGLFIGLVNLIIIISAISRGNSVLKQAGLRVGFLGVAPAELETWRRQQGLPGYV